MRLIVGFICGCICAYSSYCDYQNRKKFLIEFMSTKQIGNKKLFIDNIICDKLSDKSKIIYDRKVYINKKCMKYYDDYSLINTNLEDYYYKNYPIKIYNYWKKNDFFHYIYPSLVFNNQRLILTKNSHIHYTEQKYEILSGNKIQIENYIANNSKIAVFGENNNNNELVVEYIGKQKNVLNDIARKYYGINDMYTLLTLLMSGISLFCIFNFNSK